MNAQFKVKMDDGVVHDVHAGVADVIALEEKYGIAATDLAQNTKITWLAFLAWHALKRKNLVKEEFDVWVLRVDGLEGLEGNA